MFQPQFRTSDLRCTGAEVLARVQHPSFGLLPPSVFLPAVLATDLGPHLFEAMLASACAILNELRFPADSSFTVAVNLSPDLLLENSGWLLGRLEAREIPRERIVLEIPESHVNAFEQDSVRVLAALRLMGYRLSIDDFGSEYANLDRLLSFPVSEVKLDRSIVDRAVRWESGREFLGTLADMCISLSLSTVVEGIETPEMLALAQGVGFDAVQGYFLERPLGADAFIKKYKAGPGSFDGR